MKTKEEYQRELIECVQAGNTERAKDIKDILSGEAWEFHTFLDVLNDDREGKRFIPTLESEDFCERFCDDK